MRILIVDDDRELSEWMALQLRRNKYTVDCAYDGEEGSYLIEDHDYALVVLDLSLPGLGGHEVLARMRKRGDTTPVVVVSADDTTNSRVVNLDIGADDYLVKPFEMGELQARIRARLRRRSDYCSQSLDFGMLSLDQDSGQFSLAGRDLALTPREHALLSCLMRRPGSAVSKTVLHENIFGIDGDANMASIEIYVHRVRKKLEGSGLEVVTIRGLGYALREGHAA